MTTTTFACPGCGAETAAGTERCEHCRIRLAGELAMQLWRLDQQLAALTRKRMQLVDLLRRDDDGAPVATPRVFVPAAPGTETRRVLLGLGVVCLVAALTAGTALIWPALGVGGQTAVLMLVTAGLLVGATRLHRLPATAEALAAVGVAAVAVDAVAARRLLAPGLAGGASHGYWVAASAVAAVVLAAVGSRARWLHAPAGGAVVATFVTVAAIVSPSSVDGYAVLGLLEVGLAASVLWAASTIPLSTVALRLSASAGLAVFGVMTVLASVLASVDHRPALWCGVAISVAVAVSGRAAAGVAGGVVAGVLLTVGAVVPVHDAPLLSAGLAGAVLLACWVPAHSRWHDAGRGFAVGFAVVVQVAAQAVMMRDAFARGDHGTAAAGLVILAVLFTSGAVLATPDEAAAGAGAAAALGAIGAVAQAAASQGLVADAETVAVIALGVFVLAMATATLSGRDRGYLLARAVAAVAGATGSLATDVALGLHAVRTVEAYVVVPTVTAGVTAAVAMWRRPTLSSWALAPALAVATLPSLLLALHGDLTRQVVLLCAGAVVVVIGAQWRLLTPLVAGAGVMVLITLRVLGPEVLALPRWLSLGVLGAALLLLGATWERRLADVRVAAGRLRPVVVALR